MSSPFQAILDSIIADLDAKRRDVLPRACEMSAATRMALKHETTLAILPAIGEEYRGRAAVDYALVLAEHLISKLEQEARDARKV